MSKTLKLRRGLAAASTLTLLAFALACRQDMHDQPKYEPYEPSAFFEDGRASRPMVEGTVPRGEFNDGSLLYTGRLTGGAVGQATPSTGGLSQSGQAAGLAEGEGTSPGSAANPDANLPAQPPQVRGIAGEGETGAGFADAFPFAITAEVMDRGQERFNVFCAVCHDRTGGGNGMIVRRGYRRPPPLAEERLVRAPAGYFFDVITNGFGSMPSYSAQIPVRDRWAIVAYIRALQLSQRATVADVPAEDRSRLESGAAQQQQNPQNGRQQ
jgi:mono/diheme cytochrome c family protein